MKFLAIAIAFYFFYSAFGQNPGPGPFKHYTPRNRTYYIAAVELEWNYAPSGEDLVWGGRYGNFKTQSQRLTFKKAVYREFTDNTFNTEKTRNVNETHMGILGPIIRGVVGDTITIFFKNKAQFPFSIAAHGVVADKAHDGGLYVDGTSGADKLDDSIMPNQTFMYVWTVPAGSGPANGDPSSIVYPYHSIVNEREDINAGLYGLTVITRPDWADPVTAKPVDVDREFFVLFNIFDESDSKYTTINNVSSSLDEDVKTKHALNGLIFGNLRPLNVTEGEIVRWYVVGAGSDAHTADWHGNTLVFDNRRTIAITLTPAITANPTMTAAVPGSWLFYCHVEEHAADGMATTYTVLPKPTHH